MHYIALWIWEKILPDDSWLPGNLMISGYLIARMADISAQVWGAGEKPLEKGMNRTWFQASFSGFKMLDFGVVFIICPVLNTYNGSKWTETELFIS